VFSAKTFCARKVDGEARVLETKRRVPFEASARKVMFCEGVESQYEACSLIVCVVGGEKSVEESWAREA
jgi:hypothetical protein